MNNENIIKVADWITELGISIDVNEFSSRIKIQKLTFLLSTLFNEKMYKDFTFFTRGPYSKNLESDYYSNKEIFNEQHRPAKVSEKEREELERLKSSGVKEISAEQFEIMASLLYLKEIEKLDEQAAIEELMKRKSYLKLQDVVSGLNKLKQFMLTEKDRKELLKMLEKEMKPFEDASLADARDFLKTAE